LGAVALKMAISFIAGIVVCSLVLFGIRTVAPIFAVTDDLDGQSDNTSQGLVGLLPDIERIYYESLTLPFRKAESKIYDDDIAEFYRELLERTVLSEQGAVDR